MNHLIFSAVITAFLGIGGHQISFKPHRPFQEPTQEYYYKEPAQLNSLQLYSWPALVLPHSTMPMAVYIFRYYVLTYFACNFGQFNVHAKVFHWVLTVYLIVTLLTGFQVSNLAPYLAKVLPHILGIYTRFALCVGGWTFALLSLLHGRGFADWLLDPG
ncbi:hypothetical protein DSO57_1018760 [Entomophthora muscae]|uniref:Uncharacterized protein n=1 Tax=Entomophthora muscae TaxID=34485 RepID=A0ACC2RVH9_9FUNG|nr:hypothetical protein DSO57_1018760 [Entomophthora muscae]